MSKMVNDILERLAVRASTSTIDLIVKRILTKAGNRLELPVMEVVEIIMLTNNFEIFDNPKLQERLREAKLLTNLEENEMTLAELLSDLRGCLKARHNHRWSGHDGRWRRECVNPTIRIIIGKIRAYKKNEN